MNKDFYNKSSSNQLGWEPSWFGERYFDDKLVRAVKKFQKAHGLTTDGLCGPATFRRIWTQRQANIDDYRPTDRKYSNHLVYNGNFIPIEWDKVVLWSEKGGLSAESGNYYDYSGRADRKIRLFLNHWDVCLSSTKCNEVLNKRGISVHFLIDNDGTIFQTLDMQHGAWHGSSERVNRASVGVEISNAYYPKYQNWYARNGFGERPIISDAYVHGKKLDSFTGFYHIQLQAAKALWKAMASATDIELKTPLDGMGNASTKYERDIVYGKFSGIVSHYHCTKSKIDCAGMDIKSMLKEI